MFCRVVSITEKLDDFRLDSVQEEDQELRDQGRHRSSPRIIVATRCVPKDFGSCCRVGSRALLVVTLGFQLQGHVWRCL